MGLILAKRKCNSGSVCLESLTDAEFFHNLRDMSTWKKYINSYIVVYKRHASYL
jgi:hypothetical protein